MVAVAHRCSPAALWFFLAVPLLWNHIQTAELLRDAFSLAEADTAMWSAIKPNSVLFLAWLGLVVKLCNPCESIGVLFFLLFFFKISKTWFYMTS